jgi:peroxiredoxin
MKYLAFLAAALLLSAGAYAQNGGYKLGDKVSDFALKGSDNKNVALNDFAKSTAVVLVFTNNQCPYSKLYENRLLNLANAYAAKGVQFMFINPGEGDGKESFQEMASKNYNFPYLADEGQKISTHFGATKTPEVFVLHRSSEGFVLRYKGAIDDNPQVEEGVKNYYLKKVIDDVLANKTVVTLDKRATGCLIKKY